MTRVQRQENESSEALEHGEVDGDDVQQASDESTEEPPQEDCAGLLAKREAEIKQLQDRILRLAAEVENTRKRLEREKLDGISYANEALLRELLPVIDNLERAIEHGENETDFQGFAEGIRMTLKGLLGALAKYGCAPFDAVGKAFDPNFHEALMQEENTDYPEKTVLRELQKGYTLRERLLRPASVIVSSASNA